MNRKRKENAMVIYECDMCGKQSNCERDVHEMSVGGRKDDENLP